MNKFKAGDRVRKKNGDAWGLGSATWGTAAYDVVTVDYLSGSQVFAKETGTYMLSAALELVDNTQRKRDELEAAMKLIESYGIGCGTSKMRSYEALSYSWYTSGKGTHDTIKKTIDFHLPIKTAQQAEIERIETEMRKLADDLAKAKS